MAKSTVKKDIYTANKERQVFIKQKFEDYKSFLNCYTKSAKYSQPEEARLPQPGASAAWTSPQRSPRRKSTRLTLHGWAAKARAERVPSKRQMVKSSFSSWRVRRMNQPSCTL
jgi:hypothetical protein